MYYFINGNEGQEHSFNFSKFNFFHKNYIDSILTGEEMTNLLDLSKSISKRPIVDFVRALDKYYLHLIEEIIEFKQETRSIAQLNTRPAMIEELCDVLLYLDSITSFLREAVLVYIDNEEDTLEYYRKEEKIYGLDNEIINVNFGELKNLDSFLMEDVLENIILARRTFPERKWHKEFPENNPNTLRNFITARVDIHKAYCKVIELFVSLSKRYNIPIESIDYILYNKQVKLGGDKFVQVLNS